MLNDDYEYVKLTRILEQENNKIKFENKERIKNNMKKLLDEYGNDLLDENGCIQYKQDKNNLLHELLIKIAEHDIELLSYKGQTLFNQLSNKGE